MGHLHCGQSSHSVAWQELYHPAEKTLLSLSQIYVLNTLMRIRLRKNGMVTGADFYRVEQQANSTQHLPQHPGHHFGHNLRILLRELLQSD